MHRAVFVYARCDSRRLPRKALLNVCGRFPLLWVVLQRARLVGADTCMLLTTDRAVDDGLAELGATQGIGIVRGNAVDLVERTLQAIECCGASHFLRVNGDSPLFSPLLASRAMAYLRENALVSNLFERRFPYGVAVEWVSASHYKRLSEVAQAREREHVTAHLYRNRDRQLMLSISQTRNDSGLRLALDTQADYKRLSALIAQADPTTTEYWQLYKIPPPNLVLTSLGARNTQYSATDTIGN